MIRSYKEITNKYLLKDKKRTLLTLISVVLSVALISSVGLFFRSMQAVQIVDVKDSIGSWYVKFINPDDIVITKVKSNPAVKKIGLYKEEGLKPIDENISFRKIIVTEDSLELLPYKLKEGRFPTNSREVAVEEWFKDKIDLKCRLNENIKIGDEEYKLVGILNNKINTQANFAGDVITAGEIKGERILLVELKKHKNIKHTIEQLKSLSKNVEVNTKLLRALGAKLPPGYAVVLGVIISIIVISSMAVIYNTFQISVVDKVKEFGLLRAIGATPKQIRRIVFREATFISLIGIPIGLLCGIMALYGIDFVFKIISENRFNIISPTISKDIILLSIIVGLLSIYGSAYLPSKYASKVSPLVAISSRFMINKEKIKRRKSFLMYKLFGFEGLMAHKNINRNKKRYRVTVFSISLSIMLFILFNFLVEMFFGMYNDMGEYKNLHLIVANKSEKEKLIVEENIANQIVSLPYVRDAYIYYGKFYFNILIDKTKENGDLKKINNIYKEVNFNGEKKSSIETALFVYDEKTFELIKKHLKDGKIDKNEMDNENGVIAIENTTFFNQKRSYLGKAANFKVGDILPIKANIDLNKKYGINECVDENFKNVKVVGVIEKNVLFEPSYNYAILLTSKRVAEKLLKVKTIKPQNVMIILKDTNMQKDAQREIEKIIGQNKNLYIINVIDELKNFKSVNLMLMILLYGFVVVVSLIGSVNIINTLTTNITIRRREFAILKSVGQTQMGLKKMVLLEGMIYGISGLLWGSILGVLISYFLFTKMTMTIAQSFMVPYKAILISFIVVLLISFLSIQLALKRIDKENLIDVVREDY